MTKPSVSVIVTCYPPIEAYVADCIDSIKGQTVQADEVILVLDSYDKPMTFPGVTTVVREKNIGVARSRDEGFRLSSGEQILFVDGDDCLPEVFLEECLKVNADIVYPSSLLWCHWSEKPKANVYYEAPKLLTWERMMKQNEVLVTSLMKRKVYEAVGGFDPKLPIFEDYAFYLSAFHQGFRFKRANTYLRYRQRQNSRNHQDQEIRRDTYRQITSKYRRTTLKRKGVANIGL
jgi:glycosyltransferase involved in cell wall biosynthesis